MSIIEATNALTTTVTFPNTPNGQALYAAFVVASADKDFMDDTKKINKAVEILTPKDDTTKVFKQLQGNGLKSYLLEREKGTVTDSPEAKAAHIRDYVSTRFKKHMTDPKTATKALDMFNEAYSAKEVSVVVRAGSSLGAAVMASEEAEG